MIGTNKKDAQETVDAILADASPDGDGPEHARRAPDGAAVERLLRERQPELVTYEGWAAIDRHERSLGEAAGRPRVKLTRIEEMLRVAAGELSPSAHLRRLSPASPVSSSGRAPDF